MTDIYAQHDKTFASVSAFVVMAENERVATVAIKFPKDGAGRLYAYVHIVGLKMAKGSANGVGYDKRSAAVEQAINAIKLSDNVDRFGENAYLALFQNAIKFASWQDWTRSLESVGFKVYQAV